MRKSGIYLCFLGVELILLDGNIWSLIDAGRFWFIQGRYFVCAGRRLSVGLMCALYRLKCYIECYYLVGGGWQYRPCAVRDAIGFVYVKLCCQ